MTSPVSTTESTGLRNDRSNYIFKPIIANTRDTRTINATINDRVLSNAYSYTTKSNNGTILNEMDQTYATLSV